MENPYATPQGEIITPSSRFTPLTWKQILFSFEGRIPRRQYWAAIGIHVLGVFVTTFIAVSIPRLSGELSSESGPGVGLIVLLIPVVIVFIWTHFAVGVKRWHDRDKSGWWMLVGFIPYIGGIWQLIECGCLRGTEGENQFGGDPT
jgi:uncharacterized membrane protein YhaH (DUF805 family)